MISADSLFCQSCGESAMNAFHQHECKIFLDPSMPAKSRALCRILLQRKIGLLPDQMWQALCKMQAHYEARMSQGGAREIRDIATGAKEMTNSDESTECISNIYCIVSQTQSFQEFYEQDHFELVSAL